MPGTLRDVMTRNPQTLDQGASVVDAARIMRDSDVGAVIVSKGEEVTGIVTDRDIVVRGIADGRDAQSLTVGDVASTGVETAAPDDSIDEALQRMEKENIRRLPVVEKGKPVGIVSLGDLAKAADEAETGDTLRDISSAPPDN
jgi:CBS domain-containing protein